MSKHTPGPWLYTPTNRLRFVERTVETHRYGDSVVTTKIKVLQQWWRKWEDVPVPGGEWRDVPLEEEA